MTTTDRRDATDAQFADELARLNRLDVADVAADVREADLLHQLRMLTSERDALDRAVMEEIAERDRLYDVADRLAYAIAPMEVIGEHSSANDPWTNALEIAALKPAPGTDTSGQAVQRVPSGLWAPPDVDPPIRMRTAVAGPQRDHDEEGS